MSYTTQANVWPDAFEADGVTAQPKVGKYSGERSVGNVAGVTCASSGRGSMVFEFNVEDYADMASKGLTIPDGYGIVTAVYLETEVAFAAGTVDVRNDGTDVLAAPAALTAVGMTNEPLIAVPADLVIAAGTEMKLLITGVTGAVGSAKVIVEFSRV